MRRRSERGSSRRLAGHDYRTPGAYYVTLVTEQRIPFFGTIADEMPYAKQAGRMVEREWEALVDRFPNTALGRFVMMPDHFHGLVHILEMPASADHKDRPYTIDRGTTDAQKQPSPSTTPCRGETGVRPSPSANRPRPEGTIPGSLGRVVQAFKSTTTVRYIEGIRRQGWRRFPNRLWQPDYFDRVVGSSSELERIERYIHSNPLRWDHSTRDFH